MWFYFINEQLLRFLNMRYPRDYNTVPRLYFWLFHLMWMFPWSVYLPAVFKLSFRPIDRAGRARRSKTRDRVFPTSSMGILRPIQFFENVRESITPPGDLKQLVAPPRTFL